MKNARQHKEKIFIAGFSRLNLAIMLSVRISIAPYPLLQSPRTRGAGLRRIRRERSYFIPTRNMAGYGKTNSLDRAGICTNLRWTIR